MRTVYKPQEGTCVTPGSEVPPLQSQIPTDAGVWKMPASKERELGATGTMDFKPLASGEEGLLLTLISGIGGFRFTFKGGRKPGLV